MSYTFAKSDNTVAQRSTDGAFVPWDAQLNQPRDLRGAVGRQWIAEGSPAPAAYVAPPPSPDQQRVIDFSADTDRQNIVTLVGNATPAQIKTFCANNFPSLTAAERLTMARIILLVAMTIRT